MAIQNSSGFLSAKVLAIYDRMLLTRAVSNEVWDMFGQAKTIPANSNTKKGYANRYKNVLPATTPLVEYDGTVKTANKIIREEVEYEVAHYGDYVTYTDELDLYDYENIQSSFLDVLSDQASMTVETIRRDALRGGTNVIYANGAVSRLALVDAEVAVAGDGLITANDLKIAALKLKTQRGRKFKKVIAGTTAVGSKAIRSAYIGVVSPEVTEDLRELTKWKDVEDYSDFGKAINEDEVGSWGDFRFVESFNNDPVVQTGTDTNDYNVFLTILMAMDAYATTTIRGKGGIKTIVKKLGSSGALDPLDQFGTIGWKLIAGCAILNEAWLIRIESVATLEDGAVKHYNDYT